MTNTLGKARFRNYRVLLARLAAELIHNASAWLNVRVHHVLGCPALSSLEPNWLDAMETCDCYPVPVIEIEALLEYRIGESNGRW